MRRLLLLVSSLALLLPGAALAQVPGVLGAGCQDDVDCASGLFCIKADGQDLDGRGPAGGLCTRLCASDDDCAAWPPSTTDLLPTCENYAGLKLCFEPCVIDQVYLFQCHYRDDLACQALGELTSNGLLLGACTPLCMTDAQCGDRFCHRGLGLCQDEPALGDPVGAPCDPDATVPTCAGFCVSEDNPQGIGGLVGSCSELCLQNGPVGCGWSGSGTPEASCDFFLFSGQTAGDRSQCVQLCDCDADCHDPDFVCMRGASDLGHLGRCISPTVAAIVDHIPECAAPRQDGACLDGATRACRGDGNCLGHRSCLADSSGYGDCECSDGANAGAAGADSVGQAGAAASGGADATGGTAPDAGAQPDSGPDAPSEADNPSGRTPEPGCSCRSATGAGGRGWLALPALLALARRRRRREAVRKMSARTRGLRSVLAGFALALTVGACGKVFEYPVTRPEDAADTCADGEDNDLDGKADCFDAECAAFCSEASPQACSDGVDNDEDGALDCLDSDCADACQEKTAAACGDGVDNDADGQSDCRDADCAAFCPEASAVACANGLDDDSDSLVDCADPDCDGYCPEEATEACGDGRDNDGDGLTDGADPRCWLLSPPHTQRCAATSIDFHESFDDVYLYFTGDPTAPAENAGLFDAKWQQLGSYVDGLGVSHPGVVATNRADAPTGPYSAAVRTDPAAGLRGTGRLVSNALFAGQWASLELSFAASLRSGTSIEVALVPKDLALEYGASGERGSASLAIELDGTTSPPSLVVTAGGSTLTKPLEARPFEACGNYACDSAWIKLSLAAREGALSLRIEGSDEVLELPDLGGTELPESRLVLRGSSVDDQLARVDDLRVAVRTPSSCGSPSQVIPGSHCDFRRRFADLGGPLGLIRMKSGAYCALVAGATYPGTALSAWTSPDGGTWEPASSEETEYQSPSGDHIIGVGLAQDGDQLVAAAAVGSASGARLALARATTCAGLTALEPSQALPSDVQDLSYLLRNARHELYFTRPATDEIGPTLWRLAGDDQASLELEPQPLAEYPLAARLSTPVSISRAGRDDLLMIYPTQPSTAGPGLGIMVGSTDARSWQPLPNVPLLRSQIGAFDEGGPGSAALSFDSDAGLILYGNASTSVARLWPADGAAPAPLANACGDGACAADESCLNCPADCACPGAVLLEDDFAADASSWVVVRSADSRTPYIDRAAAALELQPTKNAWIERPLDQALVGDFELAFELTVPNSGSSAHRYPPMDSLYFGLGTPPARGASYPSGAFVRVTTYPSGILGCFRSGETYALTPFIATSEGPQGTLDTGFDDCSTDRRLPIPFDRRFRVQLSRRAGVVSAAVVDEYGCSADVVLKQAAPLPPLSSIVIGTYNVNDVESATGSAEVSHLSLRLPADPADCPSGTQRCGEPSEQPVCADTTSDLQHCGACAAACKPGADCQDESCVCPKQRADCSDECADLASSPQNCGSCGNQCEYYCLVGECDTGTSCANPRALPPGAGEYQLDFLRTPNFGSWCGITGYPIPTFVFAWTPARTGRVHLDLQGSLNRLNTLLDVTSDPSCMYFAQDGCNDDFNVAAGPSYLAVDVEQGVQYFITAGLYPGASRGPARLKIEEE